MNFEIGSAASYREFIISPLGSHLRRFEPFIPQNMLPYLNFSIFAVHDVKSDYTGWAVIGQSKNPLTSKDAILLPVMCLFQNLDISGYVIPDYKVIYEQLRHGKVVCLFLRKNLVLREMIILYTASRQDMLYPKGWLLSKYYDLDF
jgi:hypothetical protein